MEKLSLTGLTEDAARFVIFLVVTEGAFRSWLSLVAALVWVAAYWLLAWEASQDREPARTPGGRATTIVGSALSVVGGAAGTSLLLGWSARGMAFTLSWDVASVASLPPGLAVLGAKVALLGLTLVAVRWGESHPRPLLQWGVTAVVGLTVVGGYLHGGWSAMATMPIAGMTGTIPWAVLLVALVALGPRQMYPARPPVVGLALTGSLLTAVFLSAGGARGVNPAVPLLAACLLAMRLKKPWGSTGVLSMGPIAFLLTLFLIFVPSPFSIAFMGLAGLATSVDVCRRAVGCRLRHPGWWRPWPLLAFAVAGLAFAAGLVFATIAVLAGINSGIWAGLATWTFALWATLALRLRWQQEYAMQPSDAEAEPFSWFGLVESLGLEGLEAEDTVPRD